MTQDALALAAAAYDFVVPRTTRDVSAIAVNLHEANLGSGLPEHGGGPLRGGLTLTNRLTADIEDPAVPYAITLTIAARDGWLVPETLTVSERPGGPIMTSAAIRALGLSLYVQRFRERIEGTPYLVPPPQTGQGWRSFDLPANPAQLEGLKVAQLRRQFTITPEMAADAYKEALASPDPDISRRPTAAAADKLGASRGHVSRLVSQARDMGIEGLGQGRPARKRKGSR